MAQLFAGLPLKSHTYFFADDSIIFLRANVREAKTFMDIVNYMNVFQDSVSTLTNQRLFLTAISPKMKKQKSYESFR